MATLNRTDEVRLFLESLLKQTYKNFEIIIVDQNDDNRLDDIISKYSNQIYIKHIKSHIKGLSHARNIGIEQSSGDILAFPDDDCVYPHNLLESVNYIFENYNFDGITITLRDNSGKSIPKQFNNKMRKVNRLLIWTHISSIRLFMYKYVFDNIGYFDVELGVGEISKWKAAEDIDLPLRALNKGYIIEFVPYIYVIHNLGARYEKDVISKSTIRKEYEYSVASGYVMNKNNYSVYFLLLIIIIMFIKLLKDILTRNFNLVKIRYYWILGRIHGYMKKNKVEELFIQDN
jgi:glycosyltransferase involved in cell wall biosynthesis